MTARPGVSVIVVSRGRPAELQLCLTALRQQYYPAVEVVVVGDSRSLKGAPDGGAQKTTVFEAPNISAARNIGAGLAAGEILAFIDDDATAEPTWLDHLTAPFQNDRVAAAGGYVIGRNGISLQWGAQSVDYAGWSHPVEHAGDDPLILATDRDGRALRTQGTNMAVRRDVLAELGGFDEAFAFYHDETDLNLRLSEAGHLTAIVPRALVHHASATSDKRRVDRVPTTLFDIGASSAVFHRKHLNPAGWAQAREDVINAQRLRLEAMLIDGRVEPKSFETLMASLHDGYAEGLARTPGSHHATPAPPPFLAQPPKIPRHEGLSALRRDRSTARKLARGLVADGAVVSLVVLDRTARFHSTRFHPDGFWEQTGGQFGRARRSEPYVRFATFENRAAAELQRVSHFRNPLTAL